MELREILSRCDHTLLRVDATAAEIRALCDQVRVMAAPACASRRAMSPGRRTCRRPPAHLHGHRLPEWVQHPAVKAFEAAEAIRNGADEVDMVINLAMVKDGCWAYPHPPAPP